MALQRHQAQTVRDGSSSYKIDYVAQVLGYSKSQGISKLHHWFKSHDDFAEWVDFAYWWSCIGSAINKATPPSFFFFLIDAPKQIMIIY